MKTTALVHAATSAALIAATTLGALIATLSLAVAPASVVSHGLSLCVCVSLYLFVSPPRTLFLLPSLYTTI